MAIFDIDRAKELAAFAHPPCVSIYIPTHRAGEPVRQDPIRFKNALAEAEEELVAGGRRRPVVRELLQPARDLLEYDDFWLERSDGLVVFIAPETLRSHRVPLRFDERVIVGDRFYLSPLLPLLTGDGRFYLLAFSLKQVRLFSGSRDGMHQIAPDGFLPQRIEDVVGYDRPQPALQFHTRAPGRGKGGMRDAVYFGHGAAPNVEEERWRFLQRLDEGVRRLLQDRQIPLALAAVGREIATYRQLSKYPNLLERGIEGNPDELSVEKLHEQAWSLVEPHLLVTRRRARERFGDALAAGLASQDPEEIVAAACIGRVDTLFARAGHHVWGVCQREIPAVELHAARLDGDKDLADLAALETVLSGGTSYLVTADEMPGPPPLAAIFRYSLGKPGSRTS